MKDAQTRLSARYLAVLGKYLGAERPGSGADARALGQTALLHGVKTSELALMHAQAVVALTSYELNTPGEHTIKRALEAVHRAQMFFAETVVPLDAARTAARETAYRLQLRHNSLRARSEALKRGNRKLQREIARRKAGEAVIHRGRKQYQKLWAESQSMQRKLRQMARQIIVAQEEERKEISRELHDEVVQTLVGINVQLATLTKGASVGLETMNERIAQTQRLVANSVNAVHRFARELRPAVLDDLGLVPALRGYCEGLSNRRKFRIQLAASGRIESLNSPRRTALYRVAQEALTNVSRHAMASRVRLTLREKNGLVRMEVKDNGKSFAVAQALSRQNPNRIGLIGMKERIEMVGGNFRITSLPGKGTTVRAEVPFEVSKAKA
jgi:signal transduction histidine kinase